VAVLFHELDHLTPDQVAGMAHRHATIEARLL
jgi:hypothetical protein